MNFDFTQMLLIITIAWLILYFFSKKIDVKKYGVEVQPFYLIYRTKRFNHWLEEIAIKHPQFWRIVWSAGVAVSFGLMVYITYILLRGLITFIITPTQAPPSVTPLIPGITISPHDIPYFLLAAAIMLITHETAHGVAACIEKIHVKSAGVFLALIIPGGFVEPEEQSFKEAPAIAKLRVLSAGSVVNFAVGLLFLLLLMNFLLIISPLYIPTPSGVLIGEIVSGSPAEAVGLKPGDVIYGMMKNNGIYTRINSSVELGKFMSEVKPGDLLVIDTIRGSISIKAGSDKGRAIIGIYPFDYYPLRWHALDNRFLRLMPYHFFRSILWINFLAVNVALFNMLPIYPLDGDGFVYALIKSRISQKHCRHVRIGINTFFLTIVLANISLTILKYGLVVI
ncbi:site-2 protease family protein [Candidatus Bathyarchaeota archaeon]|nr:site-2 protease family protein [Candidatus Bathyarchaeota archaeon]